MFVFGEFKSPGVFCCSIFEALYDCTGSSTGIAIIFSLPIGTSYDAVHLNHLVRYVVEIKFLYQRTRDTSHVSENNLLCPQWRFSNQHNFVNSRNKEAVKCSSLAESPPLAIKTLTASSLWFKKKIWHFLLVHSRKWPTTNGILYSKWLVSLISTSVDVFNLLL
jgi:hypothetical protein